MKTAGPYSHGSHKLVNYYSAIAALQSNQMLPIKMDVAIRNVFQNAPNMTRLTLTDFYTSIPLATMSGRPFPVDSHRKTIECTRRRIVYGNAQT